MHPSSGSLCVRVSGLPQGSRTNGDLWSSKPRAASGPSHPARAAAALFLGPGKLDHAWPVRDYGPRIAKFAMEGKMKLPDTPAPVDRGAAVMLRTGANHPDARPVGLGDVVSRVAGKLGFTPCQGCRARAEALNRWMPLPGSRR